MFYAFSRNGQSFRAVELDWELGPGEVRFEGMPEPAQLAAAFPGYRPADPGDDISLAAKQALEATDQVALRCFKAGIPFPDDWRRYVIELRAIVNAQSESTALPSQPDYPAGS